MPTQLIFNSIVGNDLAEHGSPVALVRNVRTRGGTSQRMYGTGVEVIETTYLHLFDKHVELFWAERRTEAWILATTGSCVGVNVGL
jgi:hypothetical protein